MAGGNAFDNQAAEVTFIPKSQPMKARFLFYMLLLVLFASCARAVTPNEAANRSFKKCKPML